MTPDQEKLIYWITERENIRLRKEAGDDKPWTDNKVMQETYFCNIDREDDKVTRWIRDNWKYERQYNSNTNIYGNDTYHDFAMIVARIFNLPSTLKLIGKPTRDVIHWNVKSYKLLKEIKDSGTTIWNGAYLITTHGNKIDKLRYYFDLFDRVVNYQFINGYFITKHCETLAEAHKELMRLEGLASFIAAQVVADLKNSKGHHLYYAKDKRTFSACGPGSLRGLSWFFGEKITPKTYDEKIKEAYELISWELPDRIMSKLCMQNLQNCFCEYDKFMRVTNNTGRSKRKYSGI